MDLNDFLNNYMGFTGKKYKVKSYKEIPELDNIMKKFLEKGRNIHNIQPKACFHNSAFVMKADPRIKYCEGYASIKLGDSSIPIEHAWNEFEGHYFDITSDVIFDNDIGKGENEYVELYSTDDPKEAKRVSEYFIRPYLRKRK